MHQGTSLTVIDGFESLPPVVQYTQSTTHVNHILGHPLAQKGRLKELSELFTAALCSYAVASNQTSDDAARMACPPTWTITWIWWAGADESYGKAIRAPYQKTCRPRRLGPVCNNGNWAIFRHFTLASPPRPANGHSIDPNSNRYPTNASAANPGGGCLRCFSNRTVLWLFQFPDTDWFI